MVNAASAGLGLLQFCNLNSLRTKFILGFSIYLGLSVPQYFNGYVITTGDGPVHSGSAWVSTTYVKFIFRSMQQVYITDKSFVFALTNRSLTK